MLAERAWSDRRAQRVRPAALGRQWRLVVCLVMAASVSACGAGHALPTPSASSPPVFGSDEEAIAAAVATYERYLVVNAAINADHGDDAERILEVTTNRYGTQLLAEFRKMREVGVHITGTAALQKIDQVVDIDEAKLSLELVLCIDVVGTRIINEAGEDVTPEGDDVAALAVSFDTASSGRTLLAGSELWSGESSC